MNPGARPHAVGEDGLVIGGVTAQELAERFGTPLYAYDLALVSARYRGLRAALPAAAEVCYALKANPSLAVATRLARLGAGAEAASRGELLLARAAGFAPERVVMAGPAKTTDDHREALAWGIGAVNLESEAELGRLAALAGAAGWAARGGFPVGLRVNTRAAIEEERSIIGGAGPRKFGIDEEALEPVIARLQATPALRLAGVHVFNATNVRDARLLVENAARILGLAATVAAAAGTPLDYVDVGGGLGIPYHEHESPLDLAALGAGLGEVLAGLPSALAGVRLVLEPGRFLVGEAGVYLTRVVEVKESRGRRIVLVDGGVHHLLRPALVGAPHAVVAASRASQDATGSCDVAGTLCTGIDFLARDVRLCELGPGDLVAVLAAGAYGFTEAMPWFLSHPVPPEVVVEAGEAALARPRAMPEEWLARQHVPGFA